MNRSQIRLKLVGQNLVSSELGNKFGCSVSCKAAGAEYEKVGATERLPDANPVWKASFVFDYQFGVSHYLKFLVTSSTSLEPEGGERDLFLELYLCIQLYNCIQAYKLVW